MKRACGRMKNETAFGHEARLRRMDGLGAR